jgi:hypothetical protein
MTSTSDFQPVILLLPGHSLLPICPVFEVSLEVPDNLYVSCMKQLAQSADGIK